LFGSLAVQLRENGLPAAVADLYPRLLVENHVHLALAGFGPHFVVSRRALRGDGGRPTLLVGRGESAGLRRGFPQTFTLRTAGARRDPRRRPARACLQRA